MNEKLFFIQSTVFFPEIQIVFCCLEDLLQCNYENIYHGDLKSLNHNSGLYCESKQITLMIL